MAPKPVIFIIDEVPSPTNLADPGRDETHRLAAQFYAFCTKIKHPPVIQTLVSILQSPLNQAGMVRKVYVNFRTKGWFDVEPIADVVTPLRFEDSLETLFAEGVLRKTDTNEVTWQLILDDQAVIDALPDDRLIIGCASGPFAEPMKLDDFLNSDVDENTIVFVVGGNIRNGQIAPEIDNYVNVSEYEVESFTKVSRIAGALEQKWSI